MGLTHMRSASLAPFGKGCPLSLPLYVMISKVLGYLLQYDVGFGIVYFLG